MDTELQELQQDYLADVRDKVVLIRQHGEALRDRGRFKTSFPILLYIAHQLKGSGGSLGFPKITEAARKMTEKLNEFLDDASSRPSPQQLSDDVLKMASQLEQALKESKAKN